MFEIRVSAEFSAAHSLRGYKGKCEDLHGHNWKVEVAATAGALNKIGMVADFKELKEKLNKILEGLDHKHLNNIAAFKKTNPTSENLAKYIFERLEVKRAPYKIEKITVWESTNCRASYYSK